MVSLWVTVLTSLGALGGVLVGVAGFVAGRRDKHAEHENDDVDQLRESRDGWREDSEALRDRLAAAEARIRELTATMQANEATANEKIRHLTTTMQRNDAECREALAKRDGQISVMAIQITELGGQRP